MDTYLRQERGFSIERIHVSLSLQAWQHFAFGKVRQNVKYKQQIGGTFLFLVQNYSIPAAFLRKILSVTRFSWNNGGEAQRNRNLH